MTTWLHKVDKPQGWAKPDSGFVLGETSFTIEFENGYGLSVQWGTMHMCSNYRGYKDTATLRTRTAEVCEITPSGLGKIHAHCSPEHVLKLLKRMERKPTAAERAMARQCRIENQARKHG